MSVTSLSRVRTALVGVGAFAVLTAGVTVSSATAADPTPGRHGSTGAHHKAPQVAANTSLRFVRNGHDPRRSRLQVWRFGRVVADFRAGSGMGSTDECKPMKGWLPSGTYRVGSLYTNYPGTKIHGYAIPLSDGQCHGKTKTWRRHLLIHSKMTASGGSRWKGDDSYLSNGCIKLAPWDIRKLFRILKQAPRPTRLTVV
ncbi:L,D-transpeptidase [Streptomyces puniciscabiei]|uniref:L,D-transpeptidase n=1 Tax=Streptomyces puniciscabiei TaxID=164348 RepID=UPI00332FD0AF